VTTFDVVIGDAGDGQLLIMLVGGSLECGMVAESCLLSDEWRVAEVRKCGRGRHSTRDSTRTIQ
jgi:hypothetical protein